MATNEATAPWWLFQQQPEAEEQLELPEPPGATVNDKSSQAGGAGSLSTWQRSPFFILNM